MPSTVIQSFSYDAKSETLQVIFVSGLAYNYKKVPVELYNEMRAFREKGVFLNNRIKGKYEFKKL